jgi:hypothetical protein
MGRGGVCFERALFDPLMMPISAVAAPRANGEDRKAAAGKSESTTSNANQRPLGLLPDTPGPALHQVPLSG